MKKRIFGILAALALAGAGLVVTAQPAAAATCSSPYFCFFNGSTITGKYQVVTTYYQAITGTSMYTTSVQNRNSAYGHVRLSLNGSGTYGYCFVPGQTFDTSGWMAAGYRFTGIMLSYTPCP